MSYKYQKGETPDHVNSENSDSTPTPSLSLSDTTDIKKKIKAQYDSMNTELSFPKGKKRLSADDYGLIDSRMNKAQVLTDQLNKERAKSKGKP